MFLIPAADRFAQEGNGFSAAASHISLSFGLRIQNYLEIFAIANLMLMIKRFLYLQNDLSAEPETLGSKEGGGGWGWGGASAAAKKFFLLVYL